MSWDGESPSASVEDRWLTVWTLDGGRLSVRLDEESRVDAAVQQWIDMERDTILHMTILGDRQVAYLASQVVGWVPSTPESRLLETMQEARDLEEKRANRAAAGLPYEES